MNETVLALQREFDDAELRADRETPERLIADDFLSIGPKGFILNKGEWIGRHVHFPYHALDTSDVDIRCYADTAIVRNVQKNRATYQGHEMDLLNRVSQVWVNQQGQWHLAAIQCSPMEQD